MSGDDDFSFGNDGNPEVTQNGYFEEEEEEETMKEEGTEDYMLYAEDGNPIYVQDDQQIAGDTFSESPPLSYMEGPFSYPRKKNLDEIYGKQKDSDKWVVIKKPMPIYAKDKDGNEFYPKNEQQNGDEWATFQGKPVYAKDKYGIAFYPKVNGVEYVVGDMIYNKSDGSPVYPRNASSKPWYEFYAHGNTRTQEIYVTDTRGNLKFAKDDSGNEYYARDTNDDEFYPSKPFLHASDEFGIPKYAVNSENSLIYPQDPYGNEYYLWSDVEGWNILWGGDGSGEEEKTLSLKKSTQKLERYARDNRNNEMYPVRTIKYNGEFVNVDVVLNDTYAHKNDGTVFYPLDENQNEYTMEFDPVRHVERDIFPLGYPMTKDGWVILPNVQNRPFVSPNFKPIVTDKNIVGLLVRFARNNVHDYLTNVSSVRNNNTKRKGSSEKNYYNVIPLLEKKITTVNLGIKKSCWHWMLFALVVGLVLGYMCCFWLGNFLFISPKSQQKFTDSFAS